LLNVFVQFPLVVLPIPGLNLVFIQEILILRHILGGIAGEQSEGENQ
jgi:hypothetical protein